MHWVLVLAWFRYFPCDAQVLRLIADGCQSWPTGYADLVPCLVLDWHSDIFVRLQDVRPTRHCLHRGHSKLQCHHFRRSRTMSPLPTLAMASLQVLNCAIFFHRESEWGLKNCSRPNHATSPKFFGRWRPHWWATVAEITLCLGDKSACECTNPQGIARQQRWLYTAWSLLLLRPRLRRWLDKNFHSRGLDFLCFGWRYFVEILHCGRNVLDLLRPFDVLPHIVLPSARLCPEKTHNRLRKGRIP